MSVRIRKPVAAVIGILAATFALGACGNGGGSKSTSADPAPTAATSGLPQGSEPVKLDPADFTTQIDNPYWPMKPGSRWVYREVNPEDLSVEDVVVKVTNRTKKMANGIDARVVSDFVSENGVPTEVTTDYYAQDAAGNIWYLGEQTTEYANGKPKTTAGSFEAGVDGAQAGIAVPADPKPGLTYRQEYYAGQAEDRGEVVSVDEQVEPPFGHFKHALMTKDTNPLEPKVLEFKFYARDVGPVSTVGVSGGSKIEELVSYKAG
ncbi:MAG: hypothetical protein AABM43_02155 [Actinomycetota bacterium]